MHIFWKVSVGNIPESDFNVIVTSSSPFFLYYTHSTLVVLVLLAALKSSEKGSVKSTSSVGLALTAMVDRRAAGWEGWFFKKETSCFHKSHWTLRGLRGYMVWGGGPLWWYKSLMGTADNTPPPTTPPPACPAFYNPLYSGQQAEIDTGARADRQTWAVLISHQMIFEAVLQFRPHVCVALPSCESLSVRTQSKLYCV